MATREATVKLTLRLPSAAHRRLTKVAKTQERPVAWIVRQAVKEYVEAAERQEVKRGR